ncbi:hypothetical protein [Pyxidicoccus sp. MSG2]|uniref:hypothetical protein n=1 Tax=Pyxidicoccus sp. MSG2 TaxID=2996790 RepID=UPI00226E662D|nr:hypothetical protein [Pyxidicoccus sp. MSG2]MCY1019760.1 hypothetical protein [Pyxidicoccus sp. MSG2]
MAAMSPTISEHLTTAGFKGRYSITGVGWGGQTPMASVGVLRFDGQGRVSGREIMNVPGPGFERRSLSSLSWNGAYEVDPDGSGYGSTELAASLPDGSTRKVRTTLLITRASMMGGEVIVQEASLMQHDPEPASGSLVMYSVFRQPDEGSFSLSSFRGIYAGPGLGRGNQLPAAAIGIGAVNFNGAGRFTGVDVQNLPADSFAHRRIATFDTPEAHYTVDEDGLGMILAPNGQAHLVVTRSEPNDGVRLCLEYFFVTNELHPLTGNLVTTFVTRRMR